MSHFQVRWVVDADDELTVVEVHAGPAPLRIRPAGLLRLHPVQANDLDRMLQVAHDFENPANTYAFGGEAASVDGAELERHVEQRLVAAGRRST
jgi:hypothetical protein